MVFLPEIVRCFLCSARHISRSFCSDGRVEWWADYRYKDQFYRSGRWRYRLWPTCEEADPYYYDAPVPDDESRVSLLLPHGAYEMIDVQIGHDETYEIPMAARRPQGLATMHRDDWLEKVYKNSLQYKDIAAKWNISPEHPGMR